MAKSPWKIENPSHWAVFQGHVGKLTRRAQVLINVVGFVLSNKKSTMKKPKECPKCKSRNVKHILYGLPDSNEAPDGEYFGGCELRDEIWHCSDCRWEWGNRNKGTGTTFNEVPQKDGGHYAEPSEEEEETGNQKMTKDNKYALAWTLFAVAVISYNIYSNNKESPITIDKSTAIIEYWSDIKEHANGTETINACNEDSRRCYDVDADIYQGMVDEIYFSNGGYLQFGADIDENGYASDFDVEGHAWDFTVDMNSMTIDNAVTEWADFNGYTVE